MLDGKESEKSETITFKTKKAEVSDTIADRVTFEPETTQVKYSEKSGRLIPNKDFENIFITGVENNEDFLIKGDNTDILHMSWAKTVITINYKKISSDKYVPSNELKIEFSDGSKTEYYITFIK